MYDTTDGKFKLFHDITAKDVGWSIVDAAYSPDQNYIIYSSWSDYGMLHIRVSFYHLFITHSLCKNNWCKNKSIIQLIITIILFTICLQILFSALLCFFFLFPLKLDHQMKLSFVSFSFRFRLFFWNTILFTHNFVHPQFCSPTILFTHNFVLPQFCSPTILFTHNFVHPQFCSPTILFTIFSLFPSQFWFAGFCWYSICI